MTEIAREIAHGFLNWNGFCEGDQWGHADECDALTAKIAQALAAARAEALEEAAKVADPCTRPYKRRGASDTGGNWRKRREQIAAAIRALADKPEGGEHG